MYVDFLCATVVPTVLKALHFDSHCHFQANKEHSASAIMRMRSTCVLS